MMDRGQITGFLDLGGPALWVIAGLSVFTLALIAWKLWRLSLAGVWARGRAEILVQSRVAGQAVQLPLARSLRLRFVCAAMAVIDGPLPTQAKREEVTRLALRELALLRTGLRPLELIVTIAPLVGLLGTVLGMIEAFQALQDSGARADPSVLAGGIWEALLTTAAGMAVAIPAAVALSAFEGLAERVQADLEDMATRLFVAAGVGG
jgi:biopolymer transport protein ExbB